jgi:hypothetical protein
MGFKPGPFHGHLSSKFEFGCFWTVLPLVITRTLSGIRCCPINFVKKADYRLLDQMAELGIFKRGTRICNCVFSSNRAQPSFLCPPLPPPMGTWQETVQELSMEYLLDSHGTLTFRSTLQETTMSAAYRSVAQHRTDFVMRINL